MNNTRFDCPQLMSDGNFITDYRPNGDLNSELMNHNSVCDSYQYRLFLQHNGLRIINDTKEKFLKENVCKSENFGNCFTNASKPACCNTDTICKDDPRRIKLNCKN
jgi:hypothetical protein